MLSTGVSAQIGDLSADAARGKSARSKREGKKRDLAARLAFFEESANDLRQEERSGKDRSSRETLRQSAKELSSQRCIREPPEIGKKRHAVNVNVLCGDQLQ